jgi:membrane protease YdiL (CAAX protease family)
MEYLKSRKYAILFIVVSIGFALLYKGWKYYLRNTVGLDPVRDYFAYELFNTYFRVMNSFIGMGFCWFGFANRKCLFGVGERRIAGIFLVYLLLFFLLKALFCGFPSFSWSRFSIELFFNLFTGISEEFLFRGMLLIGLVYFLGFWKAAVLAAAFFSLFHIDINPDPIYLLSLFTIALVYSLGFASGGSLLILSGIHFLWDQVVYGLIWPQSGGAPLDCALILLDLSILVLIHKTTLNRLAREPSPYK